LRPRLEVAARGKTNTVAAIEVVGVGEHFQGSSSQT
jgi:hypothetical protein